MKLWVKVSYRFLVIREKMARGCGGHTKTVTTTDGNLKKVRGSRGGVQGLASREPEAEDVIFALDPETSPWSQVGFTHDSNWLVWHLSGYSPKDTARKQKAGRQPGLLEYGEPSTYSEHMPKGNAQYIFTVMRPPREELNDLEYAIEQAEKAADYILLKIPAPE
jgi:hypothetical protein